jgi:hypothetical protein
MRAPTAIAIAGAAAAVVTVVLVVWDQAAPDDEKTASAPPTVHRPQDCPVTIPNGSTLPGERPSPDYHGNGKLWAALDRRGRFVVAPESEYLGPGGVTVDGILRPDGSVGIKFPWWRGPGVRGRVRIQARRLDAPALRVDRTIPPAGYGLTGFQAAGLDLPSVGCWQVTGSVGQVRLTFVTLVVRGRRA